MPIGKRGFQPDPKLTRLFIDYLKLKSRQSLKIECDDYFELTQIRTGFINRRKKHNLPEMRVYTEGKTLYVVKLPYKKEEEEEQ